MVTLKADIARAAATVGEDPNSIHCFFRETRKDWSLGPIQTVRFADIPDDDPGYSTWQTGAPFIGFGERHVYLFTTYDGADFIEPIPRDPSVIAADIAREVQMLPRVGGG